MAIKQFGNLEQDKARADHEVAVYKQLISVQGRVVPRLLARGNVVTSPGPPDHFVALDLIAGRAIHSTAHYQAASAALSAIHACGVLHCDIKADNIIVTGDSAFFIDFERAKIGATAELFDNEVCKLRQLIPGS